MIKWTTPTLTCTIPSDITCDYVLLTLKQGGVVIEKQVSSSDIVDGEFSVTFSQSEMGQLDVSSVYSMAEVQLNIIDGTTRSATNIIQLAVCKNLHDEAI